MKATMLKMASLMLAMTMSMPLMSCGDDDDDDDIIPPVTGETVNRPVSVTAMGRSMYTFAYDSEGRLTRLKMLDQDDPFTLDVSYSPLQLRVDYGKGETTTFTGITTDKKGYITSARVTETYDGQVYSWNTAIRYDSDGHIISMTDDEETMYYEWTRGDLTSISSDDGIDYNITYSSTDRKAGVFSPMWEPMGPMWMTGLFGAGPAHFPSTINDGDITMSLDYTLYVDGAIDTETITIYGMSIPVTYNYEATRSTGDATPATMPVKVKRHDPFRRAH